MATNMNINLTLACVPGENNFHDCEQISQATTSSLSALHSGFTPSPGDSKPAILQISKKRKRSQLEKPPHDSASPPPTLPHSCLLREERPPLLLTLGGFTFSTTRIPSWTFRSALLNARARVNAEKEADQDFRAQLHYVSGMLLWSEMQRESLARKQRLNPVLEKILDLNGWKFHGMYIDENGIVRAGFSVGNVPRVFKEDLVGACIRYVRVGKGVRWQDVPFCQPACALSVRVGYEEVETVKQLGADECTLGIVMPILEQVLVRHQRMLVDDLGNMRPEFA